MSEDNSTNIPVFSEDGDGIGDTLAKDLWYPNEIWKRYEHPIRVAGDDSGLKIIHKVKTNYWISTYGRCYSVNKSNFVQLAHGM